MKVISIFLMLFVSEISFAGFLACKEKIMRANTDKQLGVKIGFEGDVLKFVVGGKKPTDTQALYFEEISECMPSSGSTKFLVEFSESKVIRECDFVTSRRPYRKYWSCENRPLKK